MPRFSSRSSSVSAYDDDIDAITPCPLPAPTTSNEASQSKPPASLSSSSSYSSSSSHQHQPEEEPRQSRRSSSSSHHRRMLARVLGSSHKSRSPSPTTSSLHEAASEEDLDVFESRRRDSVRALERGAGGDPERLWRRMLELQQTYGCYNSARMSAALESGDASLLRPSRACLDLLNENMVLLPDDADCALRDDSNTATSSKHH